MSRTVRYVWKLVPGRAAEKLALGELTTSLVPNATWSPAQFDDDHQRWMLSQAIEIRDRICPWVTLYVGPALRVDGEIVWGYAGFIGFDIDFAMVSLCSGLGHFAETCYHELFHAIEGHLAPDLLERMSRWLAPSTDLYGTSTYHEDPFEARAHAFARLAVTLDAFPGQIEIDATRPTAAGLMGPIWSGEWAQAEVRRMARERLAKSGSLHFSELMAA